MAQKDDCICMAIGWPDTRAKGAEKFMAWCYKVGIVKDLYFKVGHASMCIIHKEKKTIEYFDFGRYTCDHGMGRARGKNTDPNLAIPFKAEFDEKRELSNLQDIVDYLFKIVRFTHGDGVIYFSLYDQMNYAKTIEFVDGIQQQGSMRYTTFAPNSTNCSRFVCGALLAGSSNTKDKIKLQLTPTLRASPIGTAVDIGYQSNIYRQKSIDDSLENFKMSRWDNFKLLWNNTKGNLVGEKIVREDLIEASDRPSNVPETAQWLGGLGEGNWVDIKQENLQGKSYIRTVSYYHDGVVNYDTVVTEKEGSSFNPLEEFKVVYDCSRLFVTVLQNNKTIRLYLVNDYESFKKILTNKSVSTWT